MDMEVLIRLLINVLEEGLVYGIMALGVYITYKVLSFPDLTVDGSFPLGCCVTAICISRGVDPVLTLALAFVSGCLAGLATGLLHVKLKIADLLSGILVMTALWSINLVILGGKAVFPFLARIYNRCFKFCLTRIFQRRFKLTAIFKIQIFGRF